MSSKMHAANMALKAYTGPRILRATANYFRAIVGRK